MLFNYRVGSYWSYLANILIYELYDIHIQDKGVALYLVRYTVRPTFGRHLIYYYLTSIED